MEIQSVTAAGRTRPRAPTGRFRPIVAFMAYCIVMQLAAGPVAATNNLMNKWIYLPEGCRENAPHFWYKDNVPTGYFRDRVSNGRMLWNNVNRELYFYRSSSSVRIWIGYQQPGWPNDKKLALANWNVFPTTEMHNATIDFNPIYSWYTGSSLPVPADKYDVYTLAGHEFGHLVQLGHSSSPDLMYDQFAAGEARRALSSHDKSGISALYRTSGC